jgi:hypothetical protein
MNRSLDNRLQLRALAYNEHGRASVKTLDMPSDFEDSHTGLECGCHANHRRKQPTHEILVSRWRTMRG